LEFEGLPSSKNQFSAVAHPQESGAAAGRLSAEPKVLDQRRKLDFKKFQRAKLANQWNFLKFLMQVIKCETSFAFA